MIYFFVATEGAFSGNKKSSLKASFNGNLALGHLSWCHIPVLLLWEESWIFHARSLSHRRDLSHWQNLSLVPRLGLSLAVVMLELEDLVENSKKVVSPDLLVEKDLDTNGLSQDKQGCLVLAPLVLLG